MRDVAGDGHRLEMTEDRRQQIVRREDDRHRHPGGDTDQQIPPDTRILPAAADQPLPADEAIGSKAADVRLESEICEPQRARAKECEAEGGEEAVLLDAEHRDVTRAEQPQPELQEEHDGGGAESAASI